MKDDNVSQTAEFMALFRAIESAGPATRRLFTDDLAYEFLSPSYKIAVKISRIPVVGLFVPCYIDMRWPGARPSGVGRTRLIDDALMDALRVGEFDQVVILGAGFDSRAYRISGIEKTRVFEVDHPSTSAKKQAEIKRIIGNVPSYVRFVPIDFNHQDLDDALRSTDFDPREKTFFIWEGVTNYLTSEAVGATFDYVAGVAPGSRIVFTYVHSNVVSEPSTFSGTEPVTKMLHQVGEPWTFGLDPDEVPLYLCQHGLDLVADICSVDYRIRYLGNKRRNLRGYEFYRVAIAEVPNMSGRKDDFDVPIKTRE